MCLILLHIQPCAGSEPDCNCCLSNKCTYMQLRSSEVTRGWLDTYPLVRMELTIPARAREMVSSWGKSSCQLRVGEELRLVARDDQHLCTMPKPAGTRRGPESRRVLSCWLCLLPIALRWHRKESGLPRSGSWTQARAGGLDPWVGNTHERPPSFYSSWVRISLVLKCCLL